MNSRTLLSAVALCALFAPGVLRAQETADQQGSIFTTQTTVVLVPTLVRDKNGAIVYTLKPEDFRLTDDGVPQKLTLDADGGSEPLALVVVLEVGGAGARQFEKYDTLAPPLGPMLGSIVGGVQQRRVAVVTFDSEPDLLQPFTSDVDQAARALRGLRPGCGRQHHFDNCAWPTAIHDVPLGDNGAAILDSLAYAVNLLRVEPPSYRRAILLISETLDRGSQTTIEQAVRAITESNTTIYSIGFSTAKSEASHYAARQLPTQPSGRPSGILSLENHHPNPPNGCMGKDPNPDPDAPLSRWSQFYDCMGQLLPPLTFAKMAAIATGDSLQKNVPATVARLTGGEYFKLGNEKSLERDLAAISNRLPNRYALSFHPQSPRAGLHTLRLSLPGYSGLEVTARTSYWAEASATTGHR
ncbi:VWA domain-containing protein [Occallatibacter riparius]|uniref:VWA domain-containing protein n=1 Tax=Occallatibacter riparius TaxID=1002689 RepID=A0A9J7BVI7_9BACT|nr:VWA domain-containing protein [Occallatibacter riparius]UWZ86703.1 VWA domain-containing protein [Occallatibacter riparius]